MKDEDGLHDVGDPVCAAAELPQEAPALESRHGLLSDGGSWRGCCCDGASISSAGGPGTGLGRVRRLLGAALSAQHFSSPAASASMIPWVRAAVRSWTDPGRAGDAHNSRPRGSAEDLDVHAVAPVFPGVVRGVGGDPVDRQEGAVQDHERLAPGVLHRLGQGRGEGGQDIDYLAYVAIDGRDTDVNPGGELGIGIAAPQVSQGEQGLPACRQAPSARPDLPSPGQQLSAQVARGAAGQINRRRVDKHAKLLLGHGGSWS